MTTAAIDGPQAKNSAERLRTVVQPLVAIVLAAGALIWAFTRDLSATQKENVNTSNVATVIGQHVLLTITITIVVVLVAVPAGILVTRPKARLLRPIIVGVGNIGQAAPAIGLLVLAVLWTGATGFWVGVLPIALYSLLPVLSNTILGLESVDKALLDTADGQGLSPAGVLFRVQLPLAVPYILAGLRTSLVLAVGTATLCFLVNAGGLGILIDTGYKLRDQVTLVLGSLLAVSLALLVDWLGGLAESHLSPKGVR